MNKVMFCFWQKLEFLLSPLIPLFLVYSLFSYSLLKYKKIITTVLNIIYCDILLDYFYNMN